MDKIENELGSNFADGETWLLGSSLSAVDIMLAVALNRLALLGFGERFWGQRSFLQKFVLQVQSRASFSEAVARVGLSEAAGIHLDSGPRKNV